jgi:sugar phosphate isomerase/epimerase
MERRIFLELGGSIIIGTMITPSFIDLVIPDAKLKNIGLQLYTVRDDMDKNPAATLKKIASIGYRHVECAGYNNGKFYGLDKKDFKALLDDNGLKMWSGHTNTGFGKPEGTLSMTHKWERVCEDAVFMGQKYIGCGYFEVNERKTIEDYKRHAALFNACAETAKKFDLTFFHHNHDFEFVPIDGVVPYQILMNETDKNLVKFELDHYWTKKADVDSIKLMAQHSSRFPLWHIKDMADNATKSFTEVGTGTIDYASLFTSKATSLMDLFFVEQDSNHHISPLQSIEISFKNLEKIIQ